MDDEPKPKPLPRAWSVEEVARHLGAHPQTVRRMMRDGRLRAIRVGREKRVVEESLREFLKGEKG